MPPAGYFIDSNLLVLLIVGDVGPELIRKHRRLQMFTPEDYYKLSTLLDTVQSAFVTPNTLTEASNLLAQHREPERSILFSRLRYLIRQSQEVVVASADAAANTAFARLGLTDAALLQAVSASTPVLTVDLNLCVAAWSKDPEAAVNFTRLPST